MISHFKYAPHPRRISARRGRANASRGAWRSRAASHRMRGARHAERRECEPRSGEGGAVPHALEEYPLPAFLNATQYKALRLSSTILLMYRKGWPSRIRLSGLKE